MVSKFFQRTVLSHIAFVGIGYLLLLTLGKTLFLAYADDGRVYGRPPEAIVFLLTLLAAFFYSYRLKKYRPIPHNPIQQFEINAIIAIYAIVIALSLTIPLCAGLEHENEGGIWPLPAAIYIFFAWRHIYGIDVPIVQDANGRRMTLWQFRIREAKKTRSHLRRRKQRCYPC
jgi:hypothetical protein